MNPSRIDRCCTCNLPKCKCTKPPICKCGLVRCDCMASSTSSETPISVTCTCPRDHGGIVVHAEDCLLFKHEKIVYPGDETCPFCKCPWNECLCNRAGKKALDEWRRNRPMGEAPAVLETSHPLMQKFQKTLKAFLEKENALAQAEIMTLRENLRVAKNNYNVDLEAIYMHNHDTNDQRKMILEYEDKLSKNVMERNEAQKKASEANEKLKAESEALASGMCTEREVLQEIEALNKLMAQLKKWKEETEAELTANYRVSNKMKKEKRVKAEEKRELDIIIYALNNEIWNLDSKMELYKKQFEIKNNEMAKFTDKVTKYSTELEDLEMDKRRLTALWNSVINNIRQRDKVYDAVNIDYRNLQENFRTLMYNLDALKKATAEEMERSKIIALNHDKHMTDDMKASQIYEEEETKTAGLEAERLEFEEIIEMTERDEQMAQMENTALKKTLMYTTREWERRVQEKKKIEEEILENLQACLLNDKSVQLLAKGIREMRELARKMEMSLLQVENQHGKLMLDIEMHREIQLRKKREMEAVYEKVRAKEQELKSMEEKFEAKSFLLSKKQRELDTVVKRHYILKELCDGKTPQDIRIEELELAIKQLKEQTEKMQQEWLRLQGHVVKLSAQQQKLVKDITLINKQIQICEQKLQHLNAEVDKVTHERHIVERDVTVLRGRLEVLERSRKEAIDRNKNLHICNLAITHEYTANLQGAECEIINYEEDVEDLEKEKINLTQDLDRMQREALIWQRKGMLAVELNRNVKEAKSEEGVLGQMKNEIHRMSVRCNQLKRTGDKLGEDLARCVSLREQVMDKTRAMTAVAASRGNMQTMQWNYHHRLRQAKSDLARVREEIAETKAAIKRLKAEREQLEKETQDTSVSNADTEERIASLLEDTLELQHRKQWLLDRIVRSQRLGNSLKTAVKRNTLKIRKPKEKVLEEYRHTRELNERLKYIVKHFMKQYHELHEKLRPLTYTLDIFSPTATPRLTDDAACEIIDINGPGICPLNKKPNDCPCIS